MAYILFHLTFSQCLLLQTILWKILTFAVVVVWYWLFRQLEILQFSSQSFRHLWNIWNNNLTFRVQMWELNTLKILYLKVIVFRFGIRKSFLYLHVLLLFIYVFNKQFGFKLLHQWKVSRPMDLSLLVSSSLLDLFSNISKSDSKLTRTKPKVLFCSFPF